MGRILVVASLFVATACQRELATVTTESEPEFLGRFSGVYDPIGDESGRTVVVQLRDTLLFAPVFLQPDGTPALSVFAAVIEATVSPAGTIDFGRVLNIVLPGTESCVDFADFAALQTFYETCGDDDTCSSACAMVNLFDPPSTLLGTCLAADACQMSVDISGTFGRDGVELFFASDALRPAGGFQCERGDRSGGCYRLARSCDFDANRAGVFRASWTFDASQSTNTAPAATSLESDLAVAIANNLPGVVILGTLPGEVEPRGLFGPYDAYTLSIAASDGTSVVDALTALRPDPAVATTLTGAMSEDAEAGLIRLTGTLVQTDGAGLTRVYSIVALRQTGTQGGTLCDPIDLCPERAAECFYDHDVWDAYSYSSYRDGCWQDDCIQSMPFERLCAPIPDCPATVTTNIDGAQARAVQVEVSSRCRDGNTCAPHDECLEITCREGYSYETRAFIAESCFNASFESLVVHRGDNVPFLNCGASGAVCETQAIRCPLNTNNYGPDLEFDVDPRGCVTHTCAQEVRADQFCSDASVPSCAPGVGPVPRERPGEGCIELVCAGACNCDSCGGVCADLPDCDGGAITFSYDCGDCVRATCASENLECAPRPVTCVFADPPSGGANTLDTRILEDGCFGYTCLSRYPVTSECGGTLPTCNAGEALIPRSTSGSCVTYECAPLCDSLQQPCEGTPCAFTSTIPSCLTYEVRQDPPDCEGSTRVECAKDCPNAPLRCALATQLPAVTDGMRVAIGTDGCLVFDCEQTFANSALCSTTPPACASGEMARPVPTSGGCLDFECVADCSGPGLCDLPCATGFVMPDDCPSFEARATINGFGCTHVDCAP